jgi:hypothetical protein
MEVEASKRREAIRNLIRDCRRIESNVKTRRKEFKQEISHYQNYLSDFKSYIDFKSANPYAEKDVDFEREQTPWLKKRSSYTLISNNKLLNQDSSSTTLQKNPLRTSKNF